MDETNGCIFCALQHSDAAVLAANELAYAVLDIAPIRPGHTLIIPRQHVDDFFGLSEDVQAAMLALANGVAAALTDVCRPRRVGMLVAGFEIDHAHLHVLPLHDFYDLTSKVLLDGGKVPAPADELQQMQARLRARLAAP